MRSYSLFLTAFLVSAVWLSGCKSPTSATSGAPYVTITPSNFRGISFAVDTFQARIFNHDFAQTYFGWDMGDTTLFSPTQTPGDNFQVIHSYLKPGHYSMIVNAFDIYSNEKIATAQTSVIIDTAKSTVEIIPQFYNGMLSMNTFGLVPFTIFVKTSIPDFDLFQFWDFGDGTGDSFLSGPITHIFPHPGSYTMKVDLYQKNGIYVGTDTAAITIVWPDISQDSIKQAARVETYIVIDTSSSLFPTAQSSLPLPVGLPFVGTDIISSWTGNDFSVELKNNRQQDFHITGTVSTDGRSVSSLNIFAKDSSNGFRFYTFGYKVNSLQLLSITTDKIVFKTSGSGFTESLENFFFTSPQGRIFSNIGVADQWSNFIKANNNTGQPESIPQCVLVFSKQ